LTASDTARELAVAAAKAADEKLGRDIAVIDVTDVMAITDIFVVISADSERQVAAVVEEVEDALTKMGAEPKRREGNREFRWVLLDYGMLVVTRSARRGVASSTAWTASYVGLPAHRGRGHRTAGAPRPVRRRRGCAPARRHRRPAARR